jgi:hypothetical protein
MIEPSKVISPKKHIKSDTLEVIYTSPESQWSLATMIYDGRHRIGCRYNGIDNPASIGHPSTHGTPTWFILPEQLGKMVEAQARSHRFAWTNPPDETPPTAA